MTALTPTNISPAKCLAAQQYLDAKDQINKAEGLDDSWIARIRKSNEAWMRSCQYDIPSYERWIPVSVYYNSVKNKEVPERRSVALTGTVPMEDCDVILSGLESTKSKHETPQSEELTLAPQVPVSHASLNNSPLEKSEFILKLFDEIRWFGL